MKAMKAIVLGLLLMAFSIAAVAEDVTSMDGSWQITITTEDGTLSGVATLTTEDNHVVGTFKTEAGKFKVDGVATAESVRLYVTDEDGQGVIFAGPREPGVFGGDATTNTLEPLGKFSARRN